MAELNTTNITGSLSLNHQEIFSLIYPIGSIYMSVNSTNPSLLFGGTWEEFSKGRVLIGVDTSNITFEESEKTGGASIHTHSQSDTGSFSGVTAEAIGDTGATTLTKAQLPNYKIGFLPAVVPNSHGNWTNDGVQASSADLNGRQTTGNVYGSLTTQWGWNLYTMGGGESHTHTMNSHTHVLNAHTHSNPQTNSSSSLQPYTTCYMWKRIA